MILEKREYERKKYVILNETNYGDSFHGKYFFEKNNLIEKYNVKTVLDVGTGKGDAVNYMNSIGLEASGVDFAIEPKMEYDKSKFIKSFAHDIPVEDKSFDCITSFDMLEHCLEEDVDLVFKEFQRIAKKLLVMSICFNKSTTKKILTDKNIDGQLHPTVKPYEWWYEKIKKIGDIKKQDGYFICSIK